MAKVTYHAPEDDSEVVTFMGTKFFSGNPVEIDEEDNAALLAKASNNRFFEVDFEGGEAPKPVKAASSIADKGVAAKTAGKPRSVPVAYRGKPAEIEWLNGYDSVQDD